MLDYQLFSTSSVLTAELSLPGDGNTAQAITTVTVVTPVTEEGVKEQGQYSVDYSTCFLWVGTARK